MKSTFIIIATIFYFNGFAIQVRSIDYIKINDTIFTLYNCPLESYFAHYPELVPKPDIYFMHTNKQYTAIYELRGSILWLVELHVTKKDEDSNGVKTNVISEVFNGKEEVRMSWFTGTLILEPYYELPDGRQELIPKRKYTIIDIQNGITTQSKLASLKRVEKIKKNLYNEFTKKPDYLMFYCSRMTAILISNLKDQYLKKNNSYKKAPIKQKKIIENLINISINWGKH